MFVVVGIQADGRFSFNFPQFDSICPTSFRRRGVVPEGLHRMPRHGGKHPTASELLRRNPCVEHRSIICFDHRLFLTRWLIMPGSHSFPEGSREVTCHMQTEECACSHCSLLLTQRRQTCRNGVATEEELYSITYYGKGRMPVSSTS